MDSPNCIDDIFVFLKLSNKGIIEDIAFDGVACTISTASTSIMTDLVKGKSVKEAYKIIENYENMIFEKPYDKEILQEAIVFQNTYKQANRIKCATIGWNGLKEAIKLELDKQGGKKKWIKKSRIYGRLSPTLMGSTKKTFLHIQLVKA